MTQGFNEQSVLSDVVLPASLRQYQLKGIVAREHAGQIFAAWDTQLCRDVWIRRIHHQGENAAQILVEARLAAALKHPAFAKIHALEESAEDLFVIGEAMIGTPLIDWLGQNQGDHKAILNLVMQIATALAEAHQLGLVHGDIQAKQFLIDASRQVRILNCGFAGGRSSTALSSIDQIDSSGGLAYFAPERFADSTATPASDVYALGTLLYQMLNGSLPFAQLQGLAMVAAMVQADAEKWPCRAEVSPALREWMLAMLKRQPEQRISCLEIVEQGRVIREAEGYSSTNSSINLLGLQGQLAELARRKKRNRILGAVLVLSVIAGGVWLAKPDWPVIVKALTPFSESKEMAQGLECLKRYDKPGMLDQAMQHFSVVLERNPNNALAVAYLSIAYSYRFRSGSRDDVWREKAIASAQQALRLDPNLAMTQVAYALSLDPHNDFDIAMKAISKAKELESNNLIVWQTEVRTLLLARRYGETIKVADEALKQFKDDWLLLNLKGVAYLNQGQDEQADQQFRVAIDKHPDVTLSYDFLSASLEGRGKIEEALQVSQQGLQIRSDERFYRRIARLKSHQGDYSAALNAAEKASTLNPQEYENWFLLADGLKQIPSRRAESIAAYKKARELLGIRLNRRPNDAWLTALMAVLEAQLGEVQRAEQLSKRAIELGPNTAVVHLLVASVHELSGRRTQALQSLREARRLGLSEVEISIEPNFNELRKDPRYQSSLEK